MGGSSITATGAMALVVAQITKEQLLIFWPISPTKESAKLGIGQRVRICRCFITDSLPLGYPGQLVGLRRVQNSVVNEEDSRFILVRALVIE
jgi:hypothetical protein